MTENLTIVAIPFFLRNTNRCNYGIDFQPSTLRKTIRETIRLHFFFIMKNPAIFPTVVRFGLKFDGNLIIELQRF